MLVKIRKTGNSLALTIPQDLASDLNLKEGDMVDVTKNGGGGLFTPIEVTQKLDPQLKEKVHKEIERFRYDLDILAKADPRDGN